jgi:hypothetical protein
MLAFLWNEDSSKEPEVYVNVRHVFGAKCSPAIANHAVQEAARRFREELVEIIKKHFYMDDFYYGADDLDNLLQIAKEISEALGRHGFRLRKWASNSAEILKNFPVEEVAPAFRDINTKNDGALPTTKALGSRWNAEEDTLGFSTRLKPEDPKNRADVLRQLAMLYDLLQIMGPWLMRGKLLFQSIQLRTEDWTSELTDEQADAWTRWIEDLPKLATMSVPRWFGIRDQEPATLHVFGDTSPFGYGAVAYFVSASGQRSFVAAKGRVINPRKPPTIPRGELQALVLATRLGRSVISELDGYINVTKTIFWTDSRVVYWWMKNEKDEFKEFVANRLSEIHETMEVLQARQPSIRWVNTEANPADLISRGVDGDTMLARADFWLQGPDFITKDEENWPRAPERPENAEEIKIRSCIALVTTNDETTNEPLCDKFTTLVELCQSIATEPITKTDIDAVEEELVRQAQADCYAEELKQLKKIQRQVGEGKLATVIFKSGLLLRKEILLDEDGLLRLVTRVVGAEFLPWEERYPLLLPSQHAATRLLIRDCHFRAGHAGTKITWALMQKKFFVAISAVKRVVFWCDLCRNRKPLPVQLPQANLHWNRLGLGGAVFERTGIDHFGPFEIRRKKKCWGLLFICLSTRAVHIEVCEDLSIPSWLNSMERFIARRGSPKTVISDRSSTFVGGSKVFHQLTAQYLDDKFYEGLRDELATKLRIDFEVIPAGTPHYGGSWERMVQEAKRFLVKSASTVRQLTYDSLVTILVRAEGILNQRPLTISDDDRIITPAHILAPATRMGFGLGPGSTFSRVAGQLRQAIHHFWRNWTDHYLKMTSVDRFKQGHPMFIELRPGDKVLVPKEGKKKAFGKKEFKVGEVVMVHQSGDQRPREVDVRDGQGLVQRLVATNLHLAEEDVIRRRR